MDEFDQQFRNEFDVEITSVLNRDLKALSRTNPIHFDRSKFAIDDSGFVSAAAAAGLPVTPALIDLVAFDTWYDQNNYRDRFPVYANTYPSDDLLRKKALEHWLSLIYCPAPKGVAIDVGGSTSPFADLVRSRSTRCYHLDLPLPHLKILPGVHGDMIGASADSIPLENGTVDAIYSHNAVEHFEGGAFFGFFTEAARILKPGGQLCVAPLFVGKTSFAYTSLSAWYKYKRFPNFPKRLDIVVQEWVRQPFSYHISAETLKKDVIEKVDLDFKIVWFENYRQATLGFPFMIVGTKRQGGKSEPLRKLPSLLSYFSRIRQR